MSQTINVPRELLEIAWRHMPSPDCADLDADHAGAIAAWHLAVSAILAAPRQPEGDHGWLVSLDLPEVQCNCAWNPDSHDKTCPVYLRDRMADAQLAIAELREECERLRKITSVTMGVGSGGGQLFVHGDYDSIKAAQAIVLERDTLRQQLAERDAEIERLRGRLEKAWLEGDRLAMQGCELQQAIAQRDKLAGLLYEASGELRTDRHHGLGPRIDAALAEVNK